MLEGLRHRSPTAADQAVLARWSGWGSLSEVFDERGDSQPAARAEVRRLLGSESAWSEARRSTLNAHYTPLEIANAAWRTVHQLGFEGGRVLEPGCGSGNFIGAAPAGCDLVGIEADRTTAEIAWHLYGANADIVHQRFEQYEARDNSFDLVIGNVPFAKVVAHDPVHNRSRHALHNYFIVKGLHLTRPGGLVAVITSRYTMDARERRARDEINQLGDLVGAIRFPAGTFSEIAGTDVVCDLIVLRRRDRDSPARGHPWSNAVRASVPGEAEQKSVLINEYFDRHPEQILGRLAIGRGMYREAEITVEPTEALHEALAAGTARIVQNDPTPQSRPISVRASTPGRAPSDLDAPAQEGALIATANGFARVVDGRLDPFEPRYGKDSAELRRLIALRDSARAVLDAQVDGCSDAELIGLQADLSRTYDTYRRIYGPINRYKTAKSGRNDPETGERILRRVRPRMGGFRDDPDWPLVAALEVFDDESGTAEPAAIFSRRVVSPPAQRTSASDPAEAIAICLDEWGQLEIERVADLLGFDADAARDALRGHAFDDPETGRLVPATEYLSGNVRAKLHAALEAEKGDGRWSDNVTALEAVLPRQLEPGEIAAGLGAPWIPADDIEGFCREALDIQVIVEHSPTLGRWTTTSPVVRRGSVALTSEWGTARADAVTLLDACLNQRLHTVTDETESGRRVRNDAETLAARDKQEAISERFSTWIWEDPTRSDRLAERYNERFSSTVVPSHDGSHLSLPGLADTFEPHGHQRDAVARILTDGRALLAHAVGAGKTATMVMAAMDLRRLGSAQKPAIVVPNHMLEQFTREWLQLYPTARVLIADKDRLSSDRRKEFVARCATGDWDGIVFSHSGFGRLPLGPESLAAYLGEELDRSRQALGESKAGKGLSVKRLERRIAQLEEAYQRLLATETKDDGVTFEETGIDYLFVDEAHLFKNRRVDSAIEGMAHPGSQRAQDLDAKLWTLRREHGERVVTFATATPVANSIAELWTMQSYLQPDVLASVDLRPFDAWAATFGRTVSSLELAPDGSSYRMQTRFARFQNIPELLTLYRQVADVRATEELGLPIPALAGEAAEVVIVPPTDGLTSYVSELASRAERVRNRTVDATEDNMLKITGDGRRAALDLRLVGQTQDSEAGKLATAADRIAGIHRSSRAMTYFDGTGGEHARPGALQLVFCDVSTPAGKGWNAYEELRGLLINRGVPRDGIAFVHDASTDEAKARLFEACRDGRVAVLLGSTEKMGVGTNVQRRAIALHHLDCPWRPADIEQREGRIRRQGNQNAEVQVLRYAAEGSFDIYMWQTVERKATFINQVASGRATDREVEDIGDQALSFAEVKALATGDPLILEKAAVDSEVARLTRLERAHLDDQHRLRHAHQAAEQRAERSEALVSQLEAALAQRSDTQGERFAMQIGETRFTRRADAGTKLIEICSASLSEARSRRTNSREVVGSLAGLDVGIRADSKFADSIELTVPSAEIAFRVDRAALEAGDGVSMIARLEKRVQSIESRIEEARAAQDAADREAQRAASRLGTRFDRADELQVARRRQTALADAFLEIGDQTAPTCPAVTSLASRLDQCEAAAVREAKAR